MTKSDIIRDYVQEQVGAAYVYGATGKPCTPALRRAQIIQYPDFEPQITRYCPVLSGSQSTCAGCKYNGRLAFDCAQLTRRSAEAAGLSLPSGAKSQFYSNAWEAGGPIEELPLDQVAFLYRRSGKEVPHTGVYTGDGYVVDARGHAQGVVRSLLNAYKWTDYKILRGQGSKEMETVQRDLRVTPGEPLMRGDDVLALQRRLVALGFGVGEKGPDGIFGWDTDRAVRAWQEANGLPADGVFEAGDWARFDAQTVEPPTPKPGVDFQALLTELEGMAQRSLHIIKAIKEGDGW